MKKIFYLIIILFLLNTSKAYAAPSMEYIVVNDEQKTCGRHWPGDEFNQYKLPNGWKMLGSISDLSSNECSNMSSSNLTSFYEQCCTKLGYEYIPRENITSEYLNLFSPIGLGIIVFGVFLIIMCIKYLLGKRRQIKSKGKIT